MGALGSCLSFMLCQLLVWIFRGRCLINVLNGLVGLVNVKVCEDFQLSRMMMIYWNIMAVVITSKFMILTTTLSAIIIFVIW